MSQQDISKICADSLRNFSKEKYDIKMKATHAHELVAAYFGYSSRNAMLADSKFPISNLTKAKVFVMIPEGEIDLRRKMLHDLSDNLPDSYTLGEAVYSPLFADDSLYTSEFPPFRSFEKLAIYFVESSERWKSVFKTFGNFQMEHIFQVKESQEEIKLTVVHAYRISEDEVSGAGQTMLTLQRVTGRIGFEKPQFQFEQWTGGARKVFKLKKAGQDV